MRVDLREGAGREETLQPRKTGTLSLRKTEILQLRNIRNFQLRKNRIPTHEENSDPPAGEISVHY